MKQENYISEDDPALAAYRDSLMLEDTKAKLDDGRKSSKREKRDVAHAQKLLKQDENELEDLRESLASVNL